MFYNIEVKSILQQLAIPTTHLPATYTTFENLIANLNGACCTCIEWDWCSII